MLKHQPPHNRFAAIDNDTIDEIDCMVTKGLLLTLIRQKPGEDMTVEKLARCHAQGRQMLEAAMRNLVAKGLVVKLKIQSSNGGRWRTEFTVSDRPIPIEFVQEWIESLPDAKAVRVEPAHLDPRAPEEAAEEISPTTTSQRSGKKPSDQEFFPDFPTAARPAVGGPNIGEAAAKEETVFIPNGGDDVAETENSLTASGGKSAPGRGESEPATPEEIGINVAREMLAELTRRADQTLKQQDHVPGQPGAIALPGGMALEDGRIHGLPTASEAWDTGWETSTDEEEQEE